MKFVWFENALPPKNQTSRSFTVNYVPLGCQQISKLVVLGSSAQENIQTENLPVNVPRTQLATWELFFFFFFLWAKLKCGVDEACAVLGNCEMTSFKRAWLSILRNKWAFYNAGKLAAVTICPHDSPVRRLNTEQSGGCLGSRDMRRTIEKCQI